MAESIHTPFAPLPRLASPLAVVPMKFPLSSLCPAPASMSTPLRPLEEIRLPSGGTTNTGVTVPLLPVGLFTWPVAESTNAVPPISLAYERPVMARPL